jgi:hypothetical protein
LIAYQTSQRAAIIGILRITIMKKRVQPICALLPLRLPSAEPV